MLDLEKTGPPVQISEGDIVVLPQCKSHSLRDPSASARSYRMQISWFESTANASAAAGWETNSPSSTKLLICMFRKPIRESSLLFDTLPEFLVLRREHSEPFSSPAATVALLINEVANDRAGSDRIVEYLVKALILQVTQDRSSRQSPARNSSELKLGDKVVTRALGLMHSRPDVSWTVASLAESVGLSRSAFAARFAKAVGVTPVTYLRRERMRQAAELLQDEDLGIKEIASLVGYESESAFSSAFKHWCGATPGSLRHENRPSE